MSDSYGFRVRSNKLQREMLEFLNTNAVDWPTLVGEESTYKRVFRDRIQSHRDCVIGIEAPDSFGWEAPYTYSIMRWAAIQVGKRRSQYYEGVVKPNKFDHPVPYLVTPEETWPIWVTESVEEALSFPKSRHWCAYDSLGVYWNPEVNNVLVSACVFSIVDDPARSEAMNAELKERGDRGVDEDVEIWRARRYEIQIRHNRDELDTQLSRIRTEVKRLDDLWKETRNDKGR